MKRLIVLILLLFVFAMPVSAKETLSDSFNEDFGLDRLEEALPYEAQEYMKDSEIEAGKTSWIKNFSFSKILKDIWNILKSKITVPLSTMALILGVILLSSSLTAIGNSASAKTADFAVTAVSAIVITTPIFEVVNSACEIMKTASVFMMAFVPVFATVIVANGQIATGSSMGGLLLGASQVVQMVASHLVIPLMCGYLSVSIASGVSPILSKTTLSDSIKKLSFWIMSFVTTIFLGILSIQTTINASADSLSIKTAKFVIGSSVPLAGTVLAEALTTVTASLGILKTTVAIYGVVACVVIFLPLLIELIIWRFCLNVTSIASDVLSVSNISKLLKSVDVAISVLCGIILLSMALFVISLTVVVSVGKV